MGRSTVVTLLAALALACSSSAPDGGSGSGGAGASAGCAGACGGSSGQGGTGDDADGEWPKSDCVVGQDQTCNALPTMSAIAGICGMAGTCLCRTGFALELASGKCGPLMAAPGSACEHGGGGCNDDTFSSVRAGLCLTDGSCYCLGSAKKDPQTGLCKLP